MMWSLRVTWPSIVEDMGCHWMNKMLLLVNGVMVKWVKQLLKERVVQFENSIHPIRNHPSCISIHKFISKNLSFLKNQSYSTC